MTLPFGPDRRLPLLAALLLVPLLAAPGSAQEVELRLDTVEFVSDRDVRVEGSVTPRELVYPHGVPPGRHPGEFVEADVWVAVDYPRPDGTWNALPDEFRGLPSTSVEARERFPRNRVGIYMDGERLPAGTPWLDIPLAPLEIFDARLDEPSRRGPGDDGRALSFDTTLHVPPVLQIPSQYRIVARLKLATTMPGPDERFWNLYAYAVYGPKPWGEGGASAALAGVPSIEGIGQVPPAVAAPDRDTGTPMDDGTDRSGPDTASATTLAPTADGEVYAYAYRNWNRHNRGRWHSMGAGWHAVGGEKRAYLRFDVRDAPPAGRAILRLWHHATHGAPGGEIGVYRVLGPWREGSDTYHSGEVERTAAPGELSWHRQPPMADSPVARTRLHEAGGAWVALDVTPLVRAWQRGEPNHGLVLATTSPDPTELDETSVYQFATREHPREEIRPRLVVHPGGRGPSAPPEVAGTWREVDGGCAGTTWEIRQPADAVVSLRAEVRCADGSRGRWEALDIRWEDRRTLTYTIRHDDGREERHRVTFEDDRATVRITPGGAVIHIRRE